MWAELVGRRGSLRRRVAGWTALIVLGTVLLFGVVVYVLVRGELSEALRAGPPDEIGEDGREEVLTAVLVAGPLALLCGAAAILVLVRRALAPLEQVMETARAMGASDLHRRLPLPAHRDELRELVQVLNELFARLEVGFAALSRHAADASHELRTPLAVMVADLEIALRHPRPVEEWREVAGRALDELRRLSELVEALLALSRAAAEPGVTGAEVDLGQVVREACAAFAERAERAGVVLDAPLGDGALRILGHRGALEGAVRNLVANAVGYTPRGGAVRVELGAGGDGVRLHVDDSGPGVAEDERDAIFEPFARGRAGRAADTRGVGLGLAIARRVAATHGGRLDVGRSPLGGARFTLELPLTKEDRQG